MFLIATPTRNEIRPEWREDKEDFALICLPRRGSVPEGRSDRSLARSAWTAPHQESRPVGYGLMRTDSMIGVISLS
jgi:hypothetical protein